MDGIRVFQEKYISDYEQIFKDKTISQLEQLDILIINDFLNTHAEIISFLFEISSIKKRILITNHQQ